jgi:hypothetical protein
LAGCIVLAVADQLVRNIVRVGTDQIFLFEDGTLRVSGGMPADVSAVEAEMRGLLERLLATATGVPPALLRAARRPPSNDLALFVRELEVALVPTNRGAAKRALARLCREATRALVTHPELLAEINEELQEPALSAASPIASVPIVVEQPLPESVAVAEIPDLELPNPKVQNLQPGQHVDLHPTVPTIDDVQCEPVELSDADLESVQCPEVHVDEPPAPLATACVVDDTVAQEVTAPFPLTHVVKGSAAPRPTTPAKTSARLRIRPVFRAIQVDPDLTVPMLAARLESSADLAQATPAPDKCRSGSESPAPLNSHIDALRPRVERPSVAETRPATGPHQFVAPPRFAKKTSPFAERVSQFARGSSDPADDLVDGLEQISDSDASLNAQPIAADGDSHSEKVGALPQRPRRHVG